MSTPIETNTEELQEILNTVYNLPMAGGGSAGPDLVIQFDDPNWDGVKTDYSQFTFDSADVVNTFNKLITPQPINCVLNARYWPHSGGAIVASSPHVTAYARPESNNSAIVGYMSVFFNLWREYDLNGYWTMAIDFSIKGDGTAMIQNAGFFAVTEFSSIPYPNG